MTDKSKIRNQPIKLFNELKNLQNITGTKFTRNLKNTSKNKYQTTVQVTHRGTNEGSYQKQHTRLETNTLNSSQISSATKKRIFS